MKLIIVEGGDALGKNTIIESLCKYINYDNVSVRHFGKPPKGLTPAQFHNFQTISFISEANLLKELWAREKTNSYYDETIIWNRSHLGEYVYSQMFRGGDPTSLKSDILWFENNILSSLFETYLITLTANPEFFLSKEDGNSFSQTLEEKTKELKLFKKAHDISLIRNKLLIKVDNDNVFRSKEDIFNEVIQFIYDK